MNLGFSYVGLMFLIMLTIPNLIWTKNKPKDYDRYVVSENKLLLVLERIGEVSVSCLSLIFSDFNLTPWSKWSWWLVLAFVLMIFYEMFWLRYLRSKETLQDFYSSFFGLPVAGATLPVLAFFLLAVYGKNPLLACAVTILGIGHVGIHLENKRKLGFREND